MNDTEEVAELQRSPRTFELSLPSSGNRASVQTLKHSGVVVVVGANGSGKTRLGSWIDLESDHKEACHRVSAQKSLTMSDSVSTTNVETARNMVLSGNPNSTTASARRGHKWGGKPNTHLLNDFEALLMYLFSEQHSVSERDRQERLDLKARVTSTKKTKSVAESELREFARSVDKSKLDLLKEVWERTLLTRHLDIANGTVRTRRVGDDVKGSYSGADMSDGERVVFYLIGQCLAAAKGGVIVIDEPEMHLHKAIQSSLWDQIETLRPDCQFVYLTHDVGFAASRQGAARVWLKGFDGTQWDWRILDESGEIPEELFLELVGSRKPILLVEGTRDSLDAWVYGQLCPDWTVRPSGSCGEVIRNVKAFRALSDVHEIDAIGLVDRDYRSAEEIQYLEEERIYVKSVREVENLFLTPDVVRALAKILSKPQAATERALTAAVIEQFSKDEDTFVRKWTKARLQRKLGRISIDGKTTIERQLEIDAIPQSLPAEEISAEAKRVFDELLEGAEYLGILGQYGNKGLFVQLAKVLGLDASTIFDTIKQMVSDPGNGDLRKAMTKALPRALRRVRRAKATRVASAP